LHSSVVLLVASIVGVAIFHLRSSAQENTAQATIVWEYKIISPGSNTPERMEEKLNLFGKEEWECVGVYTQVSGGSTAPNNSSAHFIMKRSKR
jgi:hypothetical protein